MLQRKPKWKGKGDREQWVGVLLYVVRLRKASLKVTEPKPQGGRNLAGRGAVGKTLGASLPGEFEAQKKGGKTGGDGRWSQRDASLWGLSFFICKKSGDRVICKAHYGLKIP